MYQIFTTFSRSNVSSISLRCLLAANFDKLSALVENSENFDATINSIEKMDTYLN